MTNPTGQIEALTKSVNDLDASRRVGWARSYEAATKHEETERDLNVARGDLAMVTKLAAYMFGMLTALQAEQLVVEQYPKLMSFLPDSPRRRGHDDTHKWLEDHEDRLEVKRDRQRQLKNENSKLWKNARTKERRDLMHRFHIPDEEALSDWLSKYPGRSDTPN